MKTLMLAIIAMFSLSSCAGLNNDYKDYSTALQSHSNAEAIRIDSQTRGIVESMKVETATENEKVMLAIIGSMMIKDLKPTRLGIEKPTTAYDVGKAVVSHIPLVATTAGFVRLGEAALDAAGSIEIDAENFESHDSFGEVEIHTLGENNAPSANVDRSMPVSSGGNNSPEVEILE